MAATALTPSTAPPPPAVRPRIVAVGTAFAIVGVLLFFGALIGIYLLTRAGVLAKGGTWLPKDSFFPLTQPNMMFATLLLSSATIQWASQSIRQDDRAHAYLAYGVTLLLGVSYLFMASYLFSILNLDIAGSSMAVLTYTITGAHVVLMVAAMVYATLMAFRALGGSFTSRNHDGASSAAMFWHASVAVFAVIWIVIYITK